MAIQDAECHNPGARASGKRNFPLAAKVARRLGVIPTWPTLQIIQLAIKSEAELFGVSTLEVAEMIVCAAKQPLSSDGEYRCLSEWEKREILRISTVDRFWFEDARWRSKAVYTEFLLRQEEYKQARERERDSC